VAFSTVSIGLLLILGVIFLLGPATQRRGRRANSVDEAPPGATTENVAAATTNAATSETRDARKPRSRKEPDFQEELSRIESLVDKAEKSTREAEEVANSGDLTKGRKMLAEAKKSREEALADYRELEDRLRASNDAETAGRLDGRLRHTEKRIKALGRSFKDAESHIAQLEQQKPEATQKRRSTSSKPESELVLRLESDPRDVKIVVPGNVKPDKDSFLFYGREGQRIETTFKRVGMDLIPTYFKGEEKIAEFRKGTLQLAGRGGEIGPNGTASQHVTLRAIRVRVPEQPTRIVWVSPIEMMRTANAQPEGFNIARVPEVLFEVPDNRLLECKVLCEGSDEKRSAQFSTKREKNGAILLSLTLSEEDFKAAKRLQAKQIVNSHTRTSSREHGDFSRTQLDKLREKARPGHDITDNTQNWIRQRLRTFLGHAENAAETDRNGALSASLAKLLDSIQKKAQGEVGKADGEVQRLRKEGKKRKGNKTRIRKAEERLADYKTLSQLLKDNGDRRNIWLDLTDNTKLGGNVSKIVLHWIIIESKQLDSLLQTVEDQKIQEAGKHPLRLIGVEFFACQSESHALLRIMTKEQSTRER